MHCYFLYSVFPAFHFSVCCFCRENGVFVVCFSSRKFHLRYCIVESVMTSVFHIFNEPLREYFLQ